METNKMTTNNIKTRTSALLREQYWMFRHPSGLSVYVFPKKMTMTYAVIASAYGSIDVSFRTEDRSDFVTVPDGVAHFLEHKLFDNPDGSDSMMRFASLGADSNAFTDYNRTAYLFNTADHFDESLEELLRFVFHPYFTPETIAKERGIIAEEIRMYRDSPYDRCLQNLMEGLYRVHPVRRHVCGTEESISRITAEMLYDCYHTFYQPSNMTLCICGDVTAEQVEGVVNRSLEGLSFENKPIVRAPIPEPETVSCTEISADMPVAKPIFYIGMKDCDVPKRAEERLRRDAVMTILTDVLFSRSSRFFQNLFEQNLLTTSYSQGYSSADGFAFHSIYGESEYPEQIRDYYLDYIREVREKGIPEDAFLRSKRGIIADQIRSFDSTEEICINLLSFAMDGADLFTYPELLSGVTREDCRQMLEEGLRTDRVCLSVIRPETK